MGHRCTQIVFSDLFFQSVSNLAVFEQRRSGLGRRLSSYRRPQVFCPAVLRADFSYSYRRRPSVPDLSFLDVFKVALSRGNLRVVQLRF
jgi:hypothetical protein